MSMVRYLPYLVVLWVLCAPGQAMGQSRLALPDAIARARSQNAGARAAESVEREAGARVSEVRGIFLPKVGLTESWQRSDQPVFVFSSILAQRRFTAANFAIDALNHPAATDNFRTALSVEQPLFSPATAASLRSARLERDVAAARRAALDQELAVDVTEAYGRVLIAMGAKRAAAAALAATTADRELAGNRRDAGRSTDADVLQVDLHLARVHERQIRAEADERISRATLNELIGADLDAAFLLEEGPAMTTAPAQDLAALEAQAFENRPELRIAALQEQMASTARDSARDAFLPEVSAQAGWEFNGGQWGSRAGSWLAGVEARVNLSSLFGGSADRARLAEAAERSTQRALEREQAQNAVRLELRTALARLDEATAREASGRAAAAQARESQRIIRDRYESGLVDVAALLGAAQAAEEADARQTAARIDVVIASANLDRALGK
jgi:outer membrane protein